MCKMPQNMVFAVTMQCWSPPNNVSLSQVWPDRVWAGPGPGIWEARTQPRAAAGGQSGPPGLLRVKLLRQKGDTRGAELERGTRYFVDNSYYVDSKIVKTRLAVNIFRIQFEWLLTSLNVSPKSKPSQAQSQIKKRKGNLDSGQSLKSLS